jgi:hypothetical protein
VPLVPTLRVRCMGLGTDTAPSDSFNADTTTLQALLAPQSPGVHAQCTSAWSDIAQSMSSGTCVCVALQGQTQSEHTAGRRMYLPRELPVDEVYACGHIMRLCCSHTVWMHAARSGLSLLLRGLQRSALAITLVLGV